jgi:PhoH-like ATPase
MKGQKVILVTKDMNLRMKARSLGLQAEDYKTDQVEDLDFAINRSVREIEGIDTEVINRIYENANGVEVEQVFPKQELKGNNYYVLKNGNASVLACYDPVRRVIRKVEKPNVFGIYPKNAEQAFAVDALLNPNIQLVAISGKAGTGKTLLALASALQQNKQYEFIYLARPIVALSSKDLGFLPGDVNEKVDPYMQPLYDNLGFIKRRFNIHGAENRLIEEMQKEQKLMISALAYIRGRSLSDVYFIVDEAQNLTLHEVKTIITRAGEGTKMVFTGDIDQIDSPYLDKKSNGLSHLFDKMQGQDIFAHVHLEKGERSKLADLASDLL